MPKIVATEGQWLEIGMERFAEGGAEQLVVEKLASALGSSKSSFYWYFGDRSVFIDRIVDAWRERATEQVMRHADAQASADQQIDSLLRQMFSVTRKGDFLFYLRRLSRTEAKYREALEEIEQSRLRFAARLFVDAGMSEHRASEVAWLLYHYYLGWYERHKDDLPSSVEVERHIGMLREYVLGG